MNRVAEEVFPGQVSPLPLEEIRPTSKEDSATQEWPPRIGPIDIRSTSLGLLAVLAAMFCLHWMQAILIPLVLSVLISYALAPVVNTLERWWIPRALGAALLLLALLGVAVYSMGPLRDQAVALLDKMPEAIQQVRWSLLEMRYSSHEDGIIEKAQKAAEEITKVTEEASPSPSPPPGVTRVQVEESGIDLRSLVWWGSLNVLAMLGQAATVLVLVYFFLASGRLYKRKLVKMTGPALSKKRITVQIIDDFNRQIRLFLFVLLITGIIDGVLAWLAFYWLGLEQAALWGLITGIASAIPYLGPIIAAGAVALIALLQFGSLEMVLAAAAIPLIITGIEGSLLTPWLTSRASNINTVTTFVALLFWGWLWGPVGLLVGVPMVIILKVCCDHIENLRPLGELLGD